MLTRSARPSLAGPAPYSPRVRPVPPPSRARNGPSATAGARTGSSSHAGGFRLPGPSGSFSGARVSPVLIQSMTFTGPATPFHGRVF